MKNRAILRNTALLLLFGILLDFGSECYVPYEMQTSADFQEIKIGESSTPSVGHFLLSRLNEGEGEYHRNSLHPVDLQLDCVSVSMKNQLCSGTYPAQVRSSELYTSSSIILLEHRFII